MVVCKGFVSTPIMDLKIGPLSGPPWRTVGPPSSGHVRGQQDRGNSDRGLRLGLGVS